MNSNLLGRADPVSTRAAEGKPEPYRHRVAIDNLARARILMCIKGRFLY